MTAWTALRSRVAMRSTLWRVLDVLWLVALAIYVLAGLELAPFHGDESTLIFMSRDYYYLVQQHDIEHVLYDPHIPIDLWEEQQLRLLNGTVGKMAMGLAWDLAGLSVDDLNQQWDWGFVDPTGKWTQWDWNHANGHVPDPELKRATRLSSALLLIVAIWAVYAIGWLAARDADPRLARLTAYASSLIYATHPNVLLNGRRAMMEGSLAAFATLTVLVGLLLFAAQRSAQRRPDTKPRTLWLLMVLLGVTAGTAISAKHTALLAVVPVWGVLLWGPPGEKWVTRANIKRLAVGGVIIVLTFLLWNPGWWTFNPEIPVKVVEWRGSLMGYQRDEGRLFGTTYESVAGRVRGLIDTMFWDGPQYSEVPQWRVWMADDIDEYESSGLAGRLGGPVWAVMGLALLGVGMVRAARSYRAGLMWLVIVWGGVTAFSLLVITPMHWARYYIPLQAPAAVLTGLGAAWLLRSAVDRWLLRSAKTDL